MPGPNTLFGPRGACLLGERGPLWVGDTGHHRLLGWSTCPAVDAVGADLLIGQPDFRHEGRNAKGNTGAATLNVPTGICECGAGMAVADAWNHRVLIWSQPPAHSHQPADIVLGQSGFDGCDSNRGRETPDGGTMFWPYGVSWDGRWLWVADTGNRRALGWQGIPNRHGQAADLVLGQRDFSRRDENAGADPSAASMRWPHSIAHWRGGLCIADAGNNRIMIWRRVPQRIFQPCDLILGQPDMQLVEHNQGRYFPCADSLNMPYGISALADWLVIADTANSRLLAWHVNRLHTGCAARALGGQNGFGAKGDNRWLLPVRDSVCWPYGVQVRGDVAVIADSGNNRVQLWRLAEGLQS